MLYIYYLYFYIFNKLLLLHGSVNMKVKKFIKFHNQFIGIQMRIGNSDLREGRVSTNSDVDLMIHLALKNFSNIKWFITGDSINLKRNLKKLYKNVIIYSANKTKHFNKYPNDPSIVIEHEILSKSSLFLISRSTYGLTSLLKSGRLLDYKTRKCFEIKKGKIYNIQDEFINFHSLN